MDAISPVEIPSLKLPDKIPSERNSPVDRMIQTCGGLCPRGGFCLFPVRSTVQDGVNSWRRRRSVKNTTADDDDDDECTSPDIGLFAETYRLGHAVSKPMQSMFSSR